MMKRDMDLVRKLLKILQDNDDPYGVDGIPEIEGYPKEQLSYHICILVEAGLIQAKSIEQLSIGHDDYFGIKLTWQGQDFINAAEDDTIWEKAKEKLIKPGVSFTFDLLKEYLKVKAKEKLGI
jgi:predicted transcriptional regulator